MIMAVSNLEINHLTKHPKMAPGLLVELTLKCVDKFLSFVEIMLTGIFKFFIRVKIP